MDGQSFDQLNRTLAAITSRRGVLRLLASGASGGLLTLLNQQNADARRKRPPRSPRCSGGRPTAVG